MNQKVDFADGNRRLLTVQTFYPSPLGLITATWDGEFLVSIQMDTRSHDSIGQEASESSPKAKSQQHMLQRFFDAFFQGKPAVFPFGRMKPGTKTIFQWSVLRACHAIPCGSTMSYAQLAAKIGSPGAARAVGQVMATNPLPLVIPCHRVLGSGGRLGGYSAPGGIQSKRWLLRLEGNNCTV